LYPGVQKKLLCNHLLAALWGSLFLFVTRPPKKREFLKNESNGIERQLRSVSCGSLANLRRMRWNFLLLKGTPKRTLASPQESLQALQDCSRREIRTVSYLIAISPC
jgi:hypothetical protein